jgi:hypothetical protein
MTSAFFQVDAERAAMRLKGVHAIDQESVMLQAAVDQSSPTRAGGASRLPSVFVSDCIRPAS